MASHFVEFEGHKMTVVAVDGVQVIPTDTQTIRLTAGQRYDVIVTGIQNPTRNFAILTQMDEAMFGGPTADSVTLANGVLQYDPSFSAPPMMTAHGNPIDDFILAPADGTPLLESPDQIISLSMNFHDTLAQGQTVRRAYINGVTYISQTVPTLYSAMTLGQDALNPAVYGQNSNPFVLQSGQVVEIRLQNMDNEP